MTTLYRLYADNGDLLYVGITKNVGARFKEHANTKPWWTEVSETHFEQYPDRATAANREREVISLEHPVHNIAWNEGERDGIHSLCYECGEPLISNRWGGAHPDCLFDPAVQRCEW